MLNMISDLETATGAGADTNAPTPFGPDACLSSGTARTTQTRESSVIYPRPRAFWAASVSGQRRVDAGLAGIAAPAFGQPAEPSKQYPHTTRIAASGATKGPHPAREPEPA
jgi:hypothetical protein